MTRYLFPAIALGALLFIGSLVYDRMRDIDAIEFERRASMQLTLAAAARNEATDSAIAAAAHRAAADSILADANAERARADSLARIARNTVRRAVPADLPPDTLRDAIIVERTAEADAWRAAHDARAAEVDSVRAAYRALERGYDALRVGYGELLVSHDALTAVLEDRPKPRAWWVPQIVAGYGATLDRRTREVSDGPTVAIGWKVGVF